MGCWFSCVINRDKYGTIEQAPDPLARGMTWGWGALFVPGGGRDESRRYDGWGGGREKPRRYDERGDGRDKSRRYVGVRKSYAAVASAGGSSTARMRRTPAPTASSLTMRNRPNSAVWPTCGPPQISRLKSPML